MTSNDTGIDYSMSPGQQGLMAIYMVFGLVAFILNIFIIFGILGNKYARKSTQHLLVVNQAIADMLYALFVTINNLTSFSLGRAWFRSKFYCDVFGFIAMFFYMASYHHLLVLALVRRYMVINTISQIKVSKIILCFLVAFIPGSTLAILALVFDANAVTQTGTYCVPDVIHSHPFFTFWGLGMILIPVPIFFICYIQIIRLAKNMFSKLEKSGQHGYRQKIDNFDRLFLLVFMVYLLSSLPYTLETILLGVFSINLPAFLDAMMVFSTMGSSIINPFLYGFISADIRRVIVSTYSKYHMFVSRTFDNEETTVNCNDNDHSRGTSTMEDMDILKGVALEKVTASEINNYTVNKEISKKTVISQQIFQELQKIDDTSVEKEASFFSTKHRNSHINK